MTVRGGNHDEVVASIRETVPAEPGVYLFKNRAGEVLYIGKSVDLRSRMLSYFRWGHDEVETRTGQMASGRTMTGQPLQRMAARCPSST